MAFFDAAIFPGQLSFGGIGGPEYSTSIVSGDAGDAQQRSAWTYPLHRYEVGLNVRKEADTATLLAFFHVIAKGRANGFRFLDFNAGESQGTAEPIGTGNDASTAYQLTKRYTTANGNFDRIITKPIAGTVHVFLDGTETTSFTLDDVNGTVTLTAGAGVAITASFQFHVPVRFNSDALLMTRVDGGWQWGSVELVEVRGIQAEPGCVATYYTATWEVDPEAGLALIYDTIYTH